MAATNVDETLSGYYMVRDGLHKCALSVLARPVNQIADMKQQSLGLGQANKRTRRREFLGEMERVVPWAGLVRLVLRYLPEGKRGRPPFPVEAMLRVHFMQQWFSLSDPAMQEALHDVPLFREFAGLRGWGNRLPDEGVDADASVQGEQVPAWHECVCKLCRWPRMPLLQ